MPEMSADAATKRTTERRRIERRGRRVHWKEPESAGRIASVLHRILRSNQGNETISDGDYKPLEQKAAKVIKAGHDACSGPYSGS